MKVPCELKHDGIVCFGLHCQNRGFLTFSPLRCTQGGFTRSPSAQLQDQEATYCQDKPLCLSAALVLSSCQKQVASSCVLGSCFGKRVWKAHNELKIGLWVKWPCITDMIIFTEMQFGSDWANAADKSKTSTVSCKSGFCSSPSISSWLAPSPGSWSSFSKLKRNQPAWCL